MAPAHLGPQVQSPASGSPWEVLADALKHDSTHTLQPAWPLAQLAPPADSGYIHVTTLKTCSQRCH